LLALIGGCGDDAGPAGEAMNDAGLGDGDGGEGDGGEPLDDASTPDGGEPDAEVIPLPEGAREVDGIVSFVDEAAARQLNGYFDPQMAAVHPNLRQGLTKSANLFLEHYEELYDFLFVFTDHEVPGGVIGAFEAVNHKAEVGTGGDIEIAAGGYKTNGRLRGVIGIQWREAFGPPASHEIMHEWGVYLDPARFGFGAGLTPVDYALHWGFTGMRGQLGGFDAETLRCATPAGAVPPCDALPSGRFQFVVGQFYPNSNPRVPYSPLELYLMGLIPASELPESIIMFDGAEQIEDSFDPVTDTVLVEADGIRELPIADILARHGEVPLSPESERSFSAAFIVVSSEPPPEQVLTDVAEWAAAFGNRGRSGAVTSFESLTGDRATLSTELGPRRTTASVIPPVREHFECDVLAQDCPRDELACYSFAPSYCALSAGIEQGGACDALHACAPGLDCVRSNAVPSVFACSPYCDPNDPAAPLSCESVCPQAVVAPFFDRSGQVLGAICQP
jgi:hypothetical protein